MLWVGSPFFCAEGEGDASAEESWVWLIDRLSTTGGWCRPILVTAPTYIGRVADLYWLQS